MGASKPTKPKQVQEAATKTFPIQREHTEEHLMEPDSLLQQ